MAATAATQFTITPLAGIDLDAKSSTLAFAALTGLIGNDGRTVFRRTSSARLPIEPVTTVGIEQMFNQRRINATVVNVMRDRFPAIFQREVRFYLEKFNKGGR